MTKTKNQVYIQLHYKVNKKTFSIFREDTFFLPVINESEHSGIIEHLRSIMHSTNEAYIKLQRVEDNGRLHKGFLPISDYINVKMYTSNGKGVISIKDWNETEESFNTYEQNITTKDFIQEIQDEINLQSNWTNL